LGALAERNRVFESCGDSLECFLTHVSPLEMLLQLLHEYGE
jgi:hypothetical protein